ncbi:MAG: DUF4012 domain-containing protein [Ardenticatenaceae bacterium]|nr:DUF4012 domain-containing protein [Ardenticatenaceae bacterium]
MQWLNARRPWGLLLLAGLALYLAVLMGQGLRLVQHVQALRAIPGAALLGDPAVARRATGELRAAADAGHRLRVTAAPPLWLLGRLGWLPLVGPTLAALQPLADAGVAFLDAGAEVAPLVEAFAAQPPAQPSSARLAAAVTAPEVQARLGRAAEALARAQAARERIGAGHATLFNHLLERLDLLLPLARAATDAGPSLPWLLGTDHPRHYLLLAQNSDELRATGGFITSIGLLTIQSGRIAALDFKDSIEVDNWTVPHPNPPDPFRRYMGIDLWVTRDANWSPDFPTAARQVADLYYNDTGLRVDGVIAADLQTLVLLVEGAGPLRFPGSNRAVTGESVLPTIEELWMPPGGVAPPRDVRQWTPAQAEWWRRRKDFIPGLMRALIDRLQTRPDRVDAGRLLAAVSTALGEKHLQLSFEHPEAQAWARAQHWAGALDPVRPGDYLLVVESNMGYNKANRAVRRVASYQVTLEPPTATATLTMTYTHMLAGPPSCDQLVQYAGSYEAMAARCYRSYVRVYVPAGSALRAAEGIRDVEQWDEAGRTVFGGFLTVAPTTSRVVSFRYDLPQTVLVNGQYMFFAQKQAGTGDLPLYVEVRGGRVVQASPDQPAPIVGSQGELRYPLTLRADQRLWLAIP